MVPRATNRLLNVGRIVTVVAVTSVVLAIVIAGIIFLGNVSSGSDLENLLFILLLAFAGINFLTGFLGPASWFIALRANGGNGWQAILVFVALIIAVVAGTTFLLNHLFKDLAAMFF
jgi:hypothetical protein